VISITVLPNMCTCKFVRVDCYMLFHITSNQNIEITPIGCESVSVISITESATVLYLITTIVISVNAEFRTSPVQ
jgi:hypothetical protein